MNTQEPDIDEPEVEEEYETEEFNYHEERLKSQATVAHAVTEEICSTALVITVFICITILLLHWT